MDELKALVATLRSLGVTKYEGLDSLGEPVKLELGPEPTKAVPESLSTTGFAPSNGRSPELNRILERLDPQYSDPALFEIK